MMFDRQVVMQQRYLKAGEYPRPAPFGGWNTRDELAAMPETDAVKLDNWLPKIGGLSARRGYTQRTTAYTSNVETLMEYKAAGVNKLLGASGGVIYEDTGTTATSLATGFTNARWQHINFNGYLHMVNGADGIRNFDGTTIATPSISGDLHTYGTANIDGVHSHRNRLYFWDSSYNSFFYGGVNNISGAFSEFPLERVTVSGGNLLIMQTISRDGGDGSDDLAAFIFDTGEVLIYQGGDPGDATDWGLVGRYFIPAPLGIRCAAKFAGDIKIATQVDIISLSEVIKNTGDNQAFVLQPSKLSGAIQEAYSLYGDNYGWQLETYAAGSWLFLNVPVSTNSRYYQYVFNLQNGAATRFTGINARCWSTFNNKLYFGGSTKTFQADSGQSDDGANIDLVAQESFSITGSAQEKHWKSYIMYVQSEGNISAAAGFGIDFSRIGTLSAVSSQVSGSVWGVAAWNTAEWSGASKASQLQFTPTGTGTVISAKSAISVKGQNVFWRGSKYFFEPL